MRADRATKWHAELCEPGSRKRSLDITLADLARDRDARAEDISAFLSAEFLSHVSLFFLRVVQEPSCAKYARDYGFIFLGNLPCRFYERPAAANASYKRQVIRSRAGTRYRYRAVASTRLWRFFSVSVTFRFPPLLSRTTRGYRNDRRR